MTQIMQRGELRNGPRAGTRAVRTPQIDVSKGSKEFYRKLYDPGMNECLIILTISLFPKGLAALTQLLTQRGHFPNIKALHPHFSKSKSFENQVCAPSVSLGHLRRPSGPICPPHLPVNGPPVTSCCRHDATARLVRTVTRSFNDSNMVLLLMRDFDDGSILKVKKDCKHWIYTVYTYNIPAQFGKCYQSKTHHPG